MGLVLLGCGGQAGAARPTLPSELGAAAATAGSAAPEAQRQRAPFSGEIVYRVTAIARGSGASRDLGELHYFISGAHWKHVDEQGDTRAVYDPATQRVHYYKPEAKVVDARVSDGPVSFEPLPQTKVVLGHVCKAFRSTTNNRTTIGFYDPELFVDPALYEAHHFGDWAETLAFTRGALILWSKMELAGGDIVSDPISIQSREFDASFWAIPDAEQNGAGAENVSAPAAR